MIITTKQLLQKYAEYSNPLDKIKRSNQKGEIFRLVKGIYETDPQAEPMFLAASIVAPSYISFEWALSYYGLIPERVLAITSATYKKRKTKVLKNHFGRFVFSDVPARAFPVGVTLIKRGEYIAQIATPEKALCDFLSKKKAVHSEDELKEMLFDDMRIDEESFKKLHRKDLFSLAPLYRKTNLYLLAKAIKKVTE
jgi:predicted transcriptional regulator of viral defense system